MLNRPCSRKMVFFVLIAVLLVINFCTLVLAFPETFKLDGGGKLAKDFSAYYIGAWRLLHDPSKVYTRGVINDGEYQIYPQPQAYKYLPSFLVLLFPLLPLSYHDALIAFDAFQFMLLPLMAFLLYRLLGKKSLAVTLPVAVIVFIPFPLPHWGPIATYYWQWAEGQAKVFETFLFLLAFYLGTRGKPYLSAIAFGFAAFDPRFALLALPLFLFYNKTNLRAAIGAGVGMMLLLNFWLFYPPTGAGFINMIFTDGVNTALYAYAYIPLFTLASLIVVNGKEMAQAFSHFMGKGKEKVNSHSILSQSN
jgi:hypothetical protein